MPVTGDPDLSAADLIHKDLQCCFIHSVYVDSCTYIAEFPRPLPTSHIPILLYKPSLFQAITIG